MLRRVLPFALFLAGSAWAQACSSSDDRGSGALNSLDAGPLDVPDAGEDGSGGEDADADAGPRTPYEGATPIQIADANEIATSPKWRPSENALYVAILTGNGVLVRMNADGSGATEVRFGDGVTYGTQGNAIDKGGALVNAERGAIVRTTAADGGFVDLATGWGDDGGIPFDTPRNLVARASDNAIFFTDPGYTVTPTVNRIFRLFADGGVAVLQELADLPRPNGIVLSKDEKALFVSFTENAGGAAAHVDRFTVAADGALSNRSRFAELAVDDEAQGLAIDDDENVYVAFKSGINVYKKDGTLHGSKPSIPIPAAIANPGAVTGVGFGGTDRKTLFATTSTGKILSMQVRVAGAIN